MSKVLIQCLKCNKIGDISLFEMKILQEEAILVCPVCSAEFALTATLQKGEPSGEEGEEFMEPMSLPPVSPTTPSPKPAPLPAPTGGGEGEESVRQPVINPRVLACGACNVEWIGHHVTVCPVCASDQVMVSTRSISERVKEAFAEVGRGVPIDHVINKMLGKCGE